MGEWEYYTPLSPGAEFPRRKGGERGFQLSRQGFLAADIGVEPGSKRGFWSSFGVRFEVFFFFGGGFRALQCDGLGRLNLSG